MRVLVLEDEHKVASALKEGLEGEGYDVVVEHTGDSALARVRTRPFDIITSRSTAARPRWPRGPEDATVAWS